MGDHEIRLKAKRDYNASIKLAKKESEEKGRNETIIHIREKNERTN